MTDPAPEDPWRRERRDDVPDAPDTPPAHDDQRDPEAQRAPGAGDEGGQPPPMRAEGGDVAYDAAGTEREPVGSDNIRTGRVRGVIGAPHATRGQGQGG